MKHGNREDFVAELVGFGYVEGDSEEVVEQKNKEIFSLLEENCSVIGVTFPTLDVESMTPLMEREGESECRLGLDTDGCRSCENFICYTNPKGTIFSHDAFTGYCFNPDKKEEE